MKSRVIKYTMRIFRLAAKLFKHEFRHGEFTLLLLSLIIAIGSLSSVGFLIQRIDGSMSHHADQLNGAQLILKSSSAVPESWLDKAQSYNLRQAQMQTFASMLVVNDEFKLAQIKAVSDNFPLQGELRISKRLLFDSISPTSNDVEQISTKAPPKGEIWLDKRLALFFNTASNKELTSFIELGESKFEPAAILERVPGQSNSFFNIAPAAMINLSALSQTGTIQPGSKVDYIYFFSSSSAQSLQVYQQWLKPRLQAGQLLRSGVDDLKAVNASLKKASDFLSLAAILTVLLSAIAIAINSYRYGQKQFKNNAIMLCLGCSEKNIIRIAVYKLFALGLAGSFIGIALGYLVYLGLLNVIDALLPMGSFTTDGQARQINFYIKPVLTGLTTGLFLLLSFSFANLSQLKNISPMGLIRKDFLLKPATENISSKVFYLMSFAGLILISFWYTDDSKITLLFYLILFVCVIMLYFVAQLLLGVLIYVGRRFQLINRLSILNLERHRQTVLLQVTTFGLIFSLLIIIFLVRTELLGNWQKQFPKQTPNHFVINVQSDERQQFEQYLQQNKIITQGLYPMVRGRLTSLNQVPIVQAVPDSAREHNALHRELNLSFEKNIGTDKKIRKATDRAEISIESSLASALNINRGDQLGFQIGSRQIEGLVTEFRTVQWDSFQPNFYIIFSPGLIEKYPMSWIASFYLSGDDKLKLNQLMAQFPGITIIDVDEILKEVQFIIGQVTHAIELIFIFIIIAGVLILSSSLLSTLSSRMYENAVIRTLGASARQLRHYLFVEFVVIALLSVLLAVLLAEVASYVLYQEIFQMEYHLHPGVWFGMSIISLISICGLGLLIVNKIFTQPAHLLLNQWTE